MPCKDFGSGSDEPREREVPLGLLRDKDIGTCFADNTIKTAKYNACTFLPKNLFEQLQRLANVYFLVISLLMLTAQLSGWFATPLSAWSTLGTLLLMMGATAVMAAVDDYQRHRDDARTNGQAAIIVRRGGLLERVEWRSVFVGDICVTCSDEEFPADLVPLACSSSEVTCYVSTANLDGETNLKIREVPSDMQLALCEGDDPVLEQAVLGLDQVSCVVVAEAPQESIHDFTGTIRLEGGHDVPLGAEHLLLRGTTLRNTAWCLGLVVYTGKDTRMVMNSRATPRKLSNIEHVINMTMIVVVTAQAALSLTSDVLYCALLPNYKELWYLFPNGFVSPIVWPNWIGYWFTFFILYSNFLPISLYATMEVVNVFQAYFLKNDVHMYDPEQDCPALVRSSNLCQELGQVSHIFSDKTGTLTQNVMELKHISIAGKIYGHTGGGRGFEGGEELRKDRGNEEQAKAIDAFMEVLAVSHTVMVSQDEAGGRKYEAESPDEGTLVETAADLGWVFLGRTGQKATVQVGSGEDAAVRTYTVLALNAFNSTRKRASVVVRTPSMEHWLLMKGADNVMLERASAAHGELEEQLSAFSGDGLRTLVLGRRRLDEAELASWHSCYERANATLQGRAEALSAAAEQIERHIEIVGATAIEDKLQVNVAETIVRIRLAGVKLWVLTGDKLETARNIGFSTRVLSFDMDILVLDVSSPNGLEDTLCRLTVQAKASSEAHVTVAMLVTGKSIEYVSDLMLTTQFLEVGMLCSVVIACRVSPLQKAQMVRLVRQNVRPSPVTLAIGDGANDVPMIQEAQVGVGISGKEGRQAVNSSDFAIAQFCFLQRLLLIHGRWNYHRICKFILYTFWKNTVLVLVMFYYTFFSGISGTSIFESTVWMSYNFLLSLPIICVGVFDRDLTAEQALEYPELYGTGRLGISLNIKKMTTTLLSALVHSLVISLVMMLAVNGLALRQAAGYYSFGTAVFSGLVISCNYRVALLTTTWNRLVVLAWCSTFVFYLAFVFVFGSMSSAVPYFYMVHERFLQQALFWVCMVSLPLLALMLDVVKAYVLKEFFPDQEDLILEVANEAHYQLPKLARKLKAWRQSLTNHTIATAKVPFTIIKSSFDFCHPEWSQPRYFIPPRDANGTDAAQDGDVNTVSAAPSWPVSSHISDSAHATSNTTSRNEASFSDAHAAEQLEPVVTSASRTPAPPEQSKGWWLRRMSWCGGCDGFVMGFRDPCPGRAASADHPIVPEWSPNPQHVSTSLAIEALIEASTVRPAGLKAPALELAVVGQQADIKTSPADARTDRKQPPSGEALPIESPITRKQSHYPVDSPFAQQRLPSYQFVLTWRVVFCAVLLAGLFLTALGLWVYILAEKSGLIAIQYGGKDASSSLRASPQEFFYRTCAPGPNGTTNSCTFDLRVPADMDSPIDVIYQITPFYQNYISYYDSVVWNELLGSYGTSSERSTSCPDGTLTDRAGNKVFPCGLQATSVFNDTLSIDGYVIDSSGIAWSSDVGRFTNPPGYPDIAGTSWLHDRYPSLIGKTEGVANQHFIVWMRPSGLPHVINPYGVLSGPPLRKGQKLTVRINASFPADAMDSSRVFSLITTNVLGGRNHFLSFTLLTAGVWNMVVAMLVLGVRLRCPRSLGKPRRFGGNGSDSDTEECINDDRD